LSSTQNHFSPFREVLILTFHKKGKRLFWRKLLLFEFRKNKGKLKLKGKISKFCVFLMGKIFSWNFWFFIFPLVFENYTNQEEIQYFDTLEIFWKRKHPPLSEKQSSNSLFVEKDNLIIFNFLKEQILRICLFNFHSSKFQFWTKFFISRNFFWKFQWKPLFPVFF